MHTCIYKHAHTFIHIHTYAHTCTCTYSYMQLRVCMHARTYTHTHTHTHTPTYTCLHTHTYTYTTRSSFIDDNNYIATCYYKLSIFSKSESVVLCKDMIYVCIITFLLFSSYYVYKMVTL